MYRASTPLHTYTFPADPNTYTAIQITYCQPKNDVTIILTKDDLTMGENNTATYRFTQEQTASFVVGERVKVQARVKDSSGNVAPSVMQALDLNDVLDDSEL